MFAALPNELADHILTSVALDGVPWVLAQICHRWRLVAISRASLWTTVVVYHTTAASFPSVREQLSRAAALPITLIFHSDLSPHSSAVLRLLSAHSEQWREATLRLSSQHFGALTAVHRRLSSLEYLSLEVLDAFGVPRHMSAKRADPFEVAPRLTRVSLQFLHDLPSPLLLPFSSLASLTGHWSWHLREILRFARNLEELNISLGFIPFRPPATRIRLPQVSRMDALTLVYLDALDLPALADLTIRAPFSIDAFLDFVSHSPPLALRTLRFPEPSDAAVPSMAAMLALSPSVTILHLTVPAASQVLRSLTPGLGHPCLGPLVNTLVLTLEAPAEEPTQSMLTQMVTTRRLFPGPCVPLEALTLICAQGALPLALDTVHALDRLKWHGMYVHLQQS